MGFHRETALQRSFTRLAIKQQQQFVTPKNCICGMQYKTRKGVNNDRRHSEDYLMNTSEGVNY